ncbi:MAG: VWA domain-containing protein [Victivallaceae bacterium]|nr:VWA domain-containing protein [Victivallaceae bacterium]
MKFLNLQVLWLLPITVVIMIAFYFRAKIARKKALQILLGDRSEDQNFVLFSPSRRALRFMLLLVAVCGLFLAVARPYWGSHIIPYENRGRDLMVLFDTSKSMLCSDIQPSRLEHAKWFIRQLASENETDRFGLVAFAGDAFLECPLTTDRTSFFQYVDELDTITIPVGGTNVQLALEKALDAFKAAQGNNRAIILVTDGDELDGDSKKVIAELKKRDIPLFVVGVGDPFVASPIPVKQGVNPVFKRDSEGKLVKTRLNEPLLSKLAAGTGGIYLRSTTAESGLSKLLKRIDQLMPEELEASKRSQPIERFYYPLIAALILLLVWALISERNSSRKLSLAAIFVIGILLASQNSFAAPAKPISAGAQPDQIQSKTVEQAEKAPEPQLDPMLEAIRAYNAGRELQLKKDAKAVEKYEQAINVSPDSTIRARAYRNLGVASHNKARGEVGKGLGQVKQQNLDGALKQLDVAKSTLNQAEEMYVEAMALENNSDQSKLLVVKKVQPKGANDKSKVKPAPQTGSAALNQQLLLRDRTMIEKLKKQIEELKKQQKKAQKKMKQAQKQQQKKNKKDQKKKQDKKKQDQKKEQQKKEQKKQQQEQQKDQNKQQQNKDQQKKQDKQQKQDQKQQNQQDKKQDQQQDAEKSLKDAQQAVDKLQDAAKKLQQKKLEEAAKKAGKELDKARQAQQKDQGDSAENHIKKAIDELDKQQKQQQKKNKSDKNKNSKDKKDDKQKNKNQDKKQDKKQDGQQGDKKLPKPEEKQGQGQQKKEKEIDPRQARAIMKLMAGKEKNLRDAIKAYRKKVYGNKKIEKDW